MIDPELKQLTKKFFQSAIILLIIMVPVFYIVINKIQIKRNEILTDIEKEKNIIIYITKYNCKKCNVIKKELKNTNIEYKELNVNNKNYDEIINKLKINNLNAPALIYVEEGKTNSYIVDIQDKQELIDYINNNLK